MPILISKNILNQIKKELENCSESFIVISAYCKLTLLQYLDSCASVQNKQIIVRMRKQDIISGATDLEIVPYCWENGWDIYFRPDLHAKTYVFDHLRGIVGSANATSRGLSLGGNGNYEMAHLFAVSDEDVRNFTKLFWGSAKMTKDIYEKMKNEIKASIAENQTEDWSNEINSIITPNYELLFAEDFPSAFSPEDASEEDLLFINFDNTSDHENMRRAFERTKCYNWLVDLLKKQDNKELYFGTATQYLHDALLDEPKPYRKEVKDLLANLLNWIICLGCGEIVVDRPNHSQRIRYVG